MDATDFAILRELTRHRVSMWGGLDPRVSSADIGERLDLHPSTVRARLRAWEEAGFLQGYQVVPNPRLFDAELAVGSLKVEQVADKAAVLEALGLVEGLVGVLDHVGPWLGYAFVEQHPGASKRRRELIARQDGVAEVADFFHGALPPCRSDPSRLDWRIVAALREDPTDSLSGTADRVGVSSRTLRRRYRSLFESRALWTVAVLDFRRFEGLTVTRLNVYLEDPGARRATVAALTRALPSAVEINPVREGAQVDATSLHTKVVEMLVPLDSPALADEAVAQAEGLPGVQEAELLVPVAYHPGGAWFDARIERLLSGREPGG